MTPLMHALLGEPERLMAFSLDLSLSYTESPTLQRQREATACAECGETAFYCMCDPVSPTSIETQREAGEGDTMELVSARDRNEVYRVNLDCGCEFRYEPDAPSPFDLQKFAACEDDSAAHLQDGRVRAKEVEKAS